MYLFNFYSLRIFLQKNKKNNPMLAVVFAFTSQNFIILIVDYHHFYWKVHYTPLKLMYLFSDFTIFFCLIISSLTMVHIIMIMFIIILLWVYTVIWVYSLVYTFNFFFLKDNLFTFWFSIILFVFSFGVHNIFPYFLF